MQVNFSLLCIQTIDIGFGFGFRSSTLFVGTKGVTRVNYLMLTVKQLCLFSFLAKS